MKRRRLVSAFSTILLQRLNSTSKEIQTSDQLEREVRGDNIDVGC